MEAVFFLAGAAVFATGFFVGRKSFVPEKSGYEKIYTNKRGLYEPVRNNGEGR